MQPLHAKYLCTEPDPTGRDRDVFEVCFDTGIYVLKRSHHNGIQALEAPSEYHQAENAFMKTLDDLAEYKAMVRRLFDMLQQERPL